MEHIIKHFNIFLASVRMEVMDRLNDIHIGLLIMVTIFVQIFLSVVFFQALYGQTESIAGWSLSEAYILLGTWHIVGDISWALFVRGFIRMNYYVTSGSLDMMLRLPMDVRSILRYRNIDIFLHIPPLVVGIMILFYGISNSSGPVHWPIYLCLLLCAIVTYYSLTVMLSSVTFYVPNLSINYIRNQVLELGQYPIAIYKGLAKLLLTFIIPLGFMFTVPARALTGNITWIEFVQALSVTVLFYYVSDRVWRRGLARYESALG